MEFAICTVAAAPVRKKLSHRSEMVNQLVFGETVRVLEQHKEWFRIASFYDDYEGWITHHLIKPIDEATALTDSSVASGLLNAVRSPQGTFFIPMGSFLTGFSKETKTVWKSEWIYEGEYRNDNEAFRIDELITTARLWVNAPYLWGGKTAMGVDCSGFVQTLFKVFGIRLKRDAYQQAEQGKNVEGLQNAQPGDVAFFQNDNGRITHVGLLTNNGEIIHASGKVRIDTLTNEGIINSANGSKTHTLHSIRRMM